MSVTEDLAAVERRVNALAGPLAALPHPSRVAPAGPFRIEVADAMHALVRRAALSADVDPALALAVARQESHFDPAATSAAGAAGLMQLMPGTARELGVTDPYDPVQNARAGTRYLRALLDRFGGDVRRAVAAYNAGPGAVAAYGGVPPFLETRRYVERVMDDYRARTSLR